MIREILKALAESGDTALRGAGIEPTRVTVTPLRAGQLALPRLAFLRVEKGSVGRIYVGDDGLWPDVTESAGSSRKPSAFDALCADLLAGLLAAIPTRRATGTVQPLQARASTIVTRGKRTYGIDFDCGTGRLRIVAELVGRGEIEAAKSSDFETCLINAALPRSVREHDELSGAGLTGALHCLAELETDIELEVAQDDAASRVYTGLIWPSAGTVGDDRLQVVATPPRSAAQPPPGTVMTGHCSVGGRGYLFTTEYAGPGRIELPAGGVLPCLSLTRPDRLVAEQRRTSFRIAPRTEIRAELEGPGGDTAAPVEVADISFSGARLIAPLDTLRAWLAPGDCVSCRLAISGRNGRLIVTGLVRRVTAVLSEGVKWQDDVGLEFIVRDADDRIGLAAVREYVLSEQRSLLARRVELPQR